MNKRKFNTNYQINSKYHQEKIEKIVEQMMDEDVNSKLFDFLFRYNTRNYPETVHNELNLPGNMKK